MTHTTLTKRLDIRVWDKEYKTWRELPDLYGDYQANAHRTYGEPFSIINFFNTEDYEKVINGELIIQFGTDLKDSNGKDIFEGDILEFDIEPGEFIKREVIFSKRGFFGCFRGVDEEKIPAFVLFPYAPVSKIIGNIFENADLLD